MNETVFSILLWGFDLRKQIRKIGLYMDTFFVILMKKRGGTDLDRKRI